jgi:hypothetical protein
MMVMMVMMVVTTPIIVTSSKLSMMGIADRRCRVGRSQQQTVEHPVGHSFQMPGQTRPPTASLRVPDQVR